MLIYENYLRTALNHFGGFVSLVMFGEIELVLNPSDFCFGIAPVDEDELQSMMQPSSRGPIDDWPTNSLEM